MKALAGVVVVLVICGATQAGELARGSVPWAGALEISAAPTSSPKKAQTGTSVVASFYDFGRVTANGERYAPMGLTAAHRSLPFGTKVRVTNKATGQSIVVRVNDRGPFVPGRALDLSRGAARAIGMERAGVAPVTMEIVADEPPAAASPLLAVERPSLGPN